MRESIIVVKGAGESQQILCFDQNRQFWRCCIEEARNGFRYARTFLSWAGATRAARIMGGEPTSGNLQEKSIA